MRRQEFLVSGSRLPGPLFGSTREFHTRCVRPHSGPSRAERGKRYWQPGKGSGEILSAEPLAGWRARRIPFASLLLAAAATVVFALPSLAAQLQYDRAAIAAGEVWRLVSGHLVHYSPDHFFWDVLAFGLLGVACERRSRTRFLICVSASAFAISSAVWCWLPGMSAYRGLSGVDSALMALLAVELCAEGIRSRRLQQLMSVAVVFAGFLFKISFELTTTSNLFVETSGSGTVGVPLAHIVGAVVGCVVGLGLTNLPPRGKQRVSVCALWQGTVQWRGRRPSPGVVGSREERR